MLRAVRHRQQVRKHHLRHTLCAIGRHIGHRDASLMRSLNVHHIVARRQHTYIFKMLKLCHLLSANHHLIGQHDLSLSSSRYRLTRAGTVVHRHLAHCLQFIPRQIAGIGTIAV